MSQPQIPQTSGPWPLTSPLTLFNTNLHVRPWQKLLEGGLRQGLKGSLNKTVFDMDRVNVTEVFRA